MKELFCCKKKQEAGEPKRFGKMKKTAAVITFCIAAALLGYGRKRQKSLASAQEDAV